MVTDKRTLPVQNEVAFVPDALRCDGEQCDGGTCRPAPTSLVPPVVRPHVPKTSSTPGPQQDFESEFQLRPSVWPGLPTALVKSPDRVAPTTLNHYAMAVSMAKQQAEGNQANGKQLEELSSNTKLPKRLTATASHDYELQLRLLEAQHKRLLAGQSQFKDPGCAHEENNVPGTTTTQREESVDSDWSTQFTPESTPGFSASPNFQVKGEYEPYWNDFTGDQVLEGPRSSFTASGQVLGQPDAQRDTLEQQSRRDRELITPTSQAPDSSFGHYQLEIMMKGARMMQHLKITEQARQSAAMKPPETIKASGVFPADAALEALRDRLHEGKLSQLLTQNRKRQIQIGLEVRQVSGDAEMQAHLYKLKYIRSLQDNEKASRLAGDEIAVDFYQLNLKVALQCAKHDGFLNNCNEYTTDTGRVFTSRDSLVEYTPQLMLLELQNKRRVRMARQEGEVQASSNPKQDGATSSVLPLDEDNTLQAHQLQSMISEQIKKRKLMERQNEEGQASLTQAQDGSTSLKSLSTPNNTSQPHQLQVMLLEQQNKRRLMMARNPDVNLSMMSPPPGAGPAFRDLDQQLRLMEEQNKNRLMMTRQEEALGLRNVEQKTGPHQPARMVDNGPHCVAGGSRSNIAHKPLVIRERPTGDD